MPEEPQTQAPAAPPQLDPVQQFRMSKNFEIMGGLRAIQAQLLLHTADGPMPDVVIDFIVKQCGSISDIAKSARAKPGAEGAPQ